MRIRSNDNDDGAIDLGPMMDLVFLLLIFFIVIAVTKKSIKELGIVPPDPTNAVADVKPKDKDLVIRVTQDGTIYVGDDQAGKQEVLDAIRDAADDKTTKVRFEVDKRAEVQHLMPIWDHLQHYGLNNWGMRVNME